MELMIVIVIIGILAAGSLIIFGDKGEKAKQASTKDMFGKMATFLGVEMMSCSMGDTTTMNGNLTCVGRTADSVIAAAVIATKEDLINPYDMKNSAVTIGGTNTSDSDVGYIRLSFLDETIIIKNIIIKTCHTKPCSNENNRLSKKIPIEIINY